MLTSPKAKNSYKFAENQYITEVIIYGFHSKPAAVISGGYEMGFAYVEEQEALLISGSNLKADLNDINIEIVWN